MTNNLEEVEDEVVELDDKGRLIRFKRKKKETFINTTK